MCKLKGITLNYYASKMVNFDVTRDIFLTGNVADVPSVVNVHRDNKVKRRRAGRATVAIVTEPVDKILFFKRRRLGDNTSVPFGWKLRGGGCEGSCHKPDSP